MPVPLVPVFWTVAQASALAAMAVYINKRRNPGPKDVWREAALDEVPEGLDVSSHRAEGETAASGTGRWRRVIRLGDKGGLEVDVTAITRIRFRKTD